MSGIDKRLDRLTLVYRRSEPPRPVTVIPGALTPREEFELDQLLARLGRTANGRTDFSALSNAEFARFDDLYRRYTGVSPDAA